MHQAPSTPAPPERHAPADGRTAAPLPHFPQARKGYDPEVVDRHLSQLHAELAELRRQLEGAKAPDAERAALLLLQQANRTADETLLGASMWAEQEKRQAHEQAQSLVASARAQAAKLVEEAEQRAGRLVADAEAATADHERRQAELRQHDRTVRNELARFARERATELRDQARRLSDTADTLEQLADASETVVDLRPASPPSAGDGTDQATAPASQAGGPSSST